MIIELFGPPGVGKTTLANALTSSLRACGQTVELVLSSRRTEHPLPLDPDERNGSNHQSTPAENLVRPVAVMFGVGHHVLVNKLAPMIAHVLANTQGADVATNLMRLAPPRNLLWSIRLREYLIRLCDSWQQASRASHLVLFDQAFVQAVCSLALLGRAPASDEKLAELLASVPKPDLLIRLSAPQEILEARLAERRRLQSRIEQLFELDASANQRMAQISDRLCYLSERGAQPVACVNSIDAHSLAQGVDQIKNGILPAMLTRGQQNSRSAAAWQRSADA